MEAGRELDALVAEKVMGYEVFRSDHAEYVQGRDWADPGEPLYYPDGIERQAATVPEYSTDIAAAWPIAQKLGLALVPQSDGDGFRWLATDVHAVNYSNVITVEPKDGTEYSADTAPHAICLAALRAVGVEL